MAACTKTRSGRSSSNTDADIKTEPVNSETTSSNQPGSVATAEENLTVEATLHPACGSPKLDFNFRPIPGRGKFMYVDISEPILDSETDEDLKSEPDTDVGTQVGKTAPDTEVTVKMEPPSESETEMEVSYITGKFNPAALSVAGVSNGVAEKPGKNVAVTETAAQSRTQGLREGNEPFSCSQCKARFTKFDHFNQHMRSHAGLKPFPCPKCEYSFRSNSHLKIHVRIHTGEKPFSCQKCGAAFSRTSSLKSHMLNKHNPAKQRVFSCSECSAVFTTSSEVKEHKQIHKESLSCSDCKAVFSCSNNLKRHMVKFHTNTHPFQCVSCTAAFSCSNDLEHHKTVHSLERPLLMDCKDKGAHEITVSEPITDRKTCEVTVSEANIGRETHEVTVSEPITSKNTPEITVSEIIMSKNACKVTVSKPITGRETREVTVSKLITNREMLLDSMPELVKVGMVEREEKVTEEKGDREEAAQKHAEEQTVRKEEDETTVTATKKNTLRRVREEPVPGSGLITKEEPFSESETDMEAETASGNTVSQVDGVDEFCSSSPEQSEGAVSRSSHTLNKVLPLPGSASDVSYVSQNSVKGQSRETSQKMPFVCECGASFTKFGDLSKHVKTHFGARPFPCCECDATFTTPSHLKSHMTIHSGEKPFLCKDCDARFARSSELKSHTLRRHTSLKTRPFPCSQCSSAFLTRWELKEHKQIHSGAKPFTCKACDAVFSCASYLKRHALRKHTPVDTRPYPCSGCSAAFRSSYELKRHEKVHTGEKPFQCSECDTVFTQSSSLQSHIKRKHSTGIPRPFSCSLCSAAFPTSYDLTQHTRTHTGEKPFQCGQCPAIFTKASSLKSHTLKKHTSGMQAAGKKRPFSCPRCSGAFYTVSDLKHHERVHATETSVDSKSD